MKPKHFIREQGLKKAREVVEGAPEGAEFYNNCIYVKNPHSEGNTDYFARWSDGFNAWLDAKDYGDFIDESIYLADLKRLVESVDLVNEFDDLEQAKYWINDMDNDMPYQVRGSDKRFFKWQLIEAIADHESIYGGGDE